MNVAVVPRPLAIRETTNPNFQVPGIVVGYKGYQITKGITPRMAHENIGSAYVGTDDW